MPAVWRSTFLSLPTKSSALTFKLGVAFSFKKERLAILLASRFRS
jgi:hypothetical protein